VALAAGRLSLHSPLVTALGAPRKSVISLALALRLRLLGGLCLSSHRSPVRCLTGGNALDLSELAGLRVPRALELAQLLSKRRQIFVHKKEAGEFSAAQLQL
jgi:hypothetical protein